MNTKTNTKLEFKSTYYEIIVSALREINEKDYNRFCSLPIGGYKRFKILEANLPLIEANINKYIVIKKEVVEAFAAYNYLKKLPLQSLDFVEYTLECSKRGIISPFATKKDLAVWDKLSQTANTYTLKTKDVSFEHVLSFLIEYLERAPKWALSILNSLPKDWRETHDLLVATKRLLRGLYNLKEEHKDIKYALLLKIYKKGLHKIIVDLLKLRKRGDFTKVKSPYLKKFLKDPHAFIERGDLVKIWLEEKLEGIEIPSNFAKSIPLYLNNLSREDIIEIVEYANKHTPQKFKLNLPTLRVGRYTLRVVDEDEFENLAAGYITECCQVLEYAGESCMKKAYKSPDAGILGFFENDKLIAQSYIWVDEENKLLVLDSIECVAKVSYSSIANLILRLDKEIFPYLNLNIAIGATSYGITPKIIEKLGDAVKYEMSPNQRYNPASYTDADKVWVIEN